MKIINKIPTFNAENLIQQICFNLPVFKQQVLLIIVKNIK